VGPLVHEELQLLRPPGREDLGHERLLELARPRGDDVGASPARRQELLDRAEDVAPGRDEVDPGARVVGIEDERELVAPELPRELALGERDIDLTLARGDRGAVTLEEVDEELLHGPSTRARPCGPTPSLRTGFCPGTIPSRICSLSFTSSYSSRARSSACPNRSNSRSRSSSERPLSHASRRSSSKLRSLWSAPRMRSISPRTAVNRRSLYVSSSRTRASIVSRTERFTTVTACCCPRRWTRPIRCSTDMGFHGRSKLRSFQQNWMLRPSPPAREATRTRAPALKRSRARCLPSGPRPPWNGTASIPSLARRSMSLSTVARYSQKMTNWPGKRARTSSAASPFLQAVSAWA